MTLEQSATAVVEQVWLYGNRSINDWHTNSVVQMDNLTPEKSGQFLQYKGEPLPW